MLAQNPWHQEGRVPTALAPTGRRALASVLWRWLVAPARARYEVILGPRRVGKTTVMYQTVAELLARNVAPNRIHCWRLDHPMLLAMPLGRIVRALIDVNRASEADPLYVMLDELTYAERWDLWLKTFHDERWPIRVVATSSSSAALKEGRLESGAGRWEEHYLPPWTFREYRAILGDAPPIATAPTLAESIRTNLHAAIGAQQDELRRYLLLGGFPELLLRKEPLDEASAVLESQRVLRNDAVQNAVYRDIPQVYGVDEPAKLERLLYVLAGQAGGILSPTRIGGSVQLSAPTIERYVSYLERAYAIFLVPNYSRAEETVQRRGRKVYFCDGAVRNAALHRGLAPLRDPNEMALLAEGAVATQLHALMQLGGGRLHYWREGRREVDFVFVEPDGPIAFEVTTSVAHGRAGIDALCSRHPELEGRCWIVGPHLPAVAPASVTNGIGTLPLDLFLMIAGAQIEATARQRSGAPESIA